MLHGWAMSQRVWRFQRELAGTCRLILPDLRGHGRSNGPTSGYSLADLAADVIFLFEQLELADALLLGWSLGSQVALAAFPQIRDRLAGLILVGATPRFTATDGYPHGLPTNEPRGMGIRLRRDFDRTMGEFFRQMFAPGELSRKQENRIAREVVKGSRLPQPAAALATLDILASADLREMLPAVDLPVLLVHGSADTICPPAAAHCMVERLPRAKLVEFEGAGHAPFLSRPGEFNDVLRNFFRDDLNGRD